MMSDFICSDCKQEFKNATSLLQHLSLQAKVKRLRLFFDNNPAAKPLTSKKLPDLYPIAFGRRVKGVKEDVEGDSGIEDVNPMRFLEVTMQSEAVKCEIKQKRQECSYCSKRFYSRNDLKRHTATHTGLKSFKCNFCDLTFNRRYLLKNHEAKAHAGLLAVKQE